MEVKHLIGEPIELTLPPLESSLALPLIRCSVEDPEGSPFDGRSAGGEAQPRLVIRGLGGITKAKEINLRLRLCFYAFSSRIQRQACD